MLHLLLCGIALACPAATFKGCPARLVTFATSPTLLAHKARAHYSSDSIRNSAHRLARTSSVDSEIADLVQLLTRQRICPVRLQGVQELCNSIRLLSDWPRSSSEPGAPMVKLTGVLLHTANTQHEGAPRCPSDQACVCRYRDPKMERRQRGHQLGHGSGCVKLRLLPAGTGEGDDGLCCPHGCQAHASRPAAERAAGSRRRLPPLV